MPARNQSDFDPNELIKTSDAHERSISELQSTVTLIEKRVGDNDKFADTFVKTFETNKKLDKVISKALITLVKTNSDVRGAIGVKVKEADRDWQKLAMKRVGFVAWTLFIAALSGGIVLLFK